MPPSRPLPLPERRRLDGSRGQYDAAVRLARRAIDRKSDSDGAYYVLGRSLFAAGHYQEVVDMVDAALLASGDDYNVYVPINNALGALGRRLKPT